MTLQIISTIGIFIVAGLLWYVFFKSRAQRRKENQG